MFMLRYIWFPNISKRISEPTDVDKMNSCLSSVREKKTAEVIPAKHVIAAALT